jgi:hypothetical protein
MVGPQMAKIHLFNIYRELGFPGGRRVGFQY